MYLLGLTRPCLNNFWQGTEVPLKRLRGWYEVLLTGSTHSVGRRGPLRAQRRSRPAGTLRAHGEAETGAVG